MNCLVISEKRVHSTMVVLLVYGAVENEQINGKCVYRMGCKLSDTSNDGWIHSGMAEKINKRGFTFWTYGLNANQITVFVDRSQFDFEYKTDVQISDLADFYNGLKWPV